MEMDKSIGHRRERIKALVHADVALAWLKLALILKGVAVVAALAVKWWGRF